MISNDEGVVRKIIYLLLSLAIVSFCIYRISTKGELYTRFDHYDIIDEIEFHPVNLNVDGVKVKVSLGIDCTDEYTSIPYIYSHHALKYPYKLSIFVESENEFSFTDARFNITHSDGSTEISKWISPKVSSNPSKQFSNGKAPPLSLSDSETLNFTLMLECRINEKPFKLQLFPPIADVPANSNAIVKMQYHLSLDQLKKVQKKL